MTQLNLANFNTNLM
jgi:hypothetical protein